MTYEHTPSLTAAQEALIALRKNVRRLHWMSGGRGYDMGRRELERQLTVRRCGWCGHELPDHHPICRVLRFRGRRR